MNRLAQHVLPSRLLSGSINLYDSFAQFFKALGSVLQVQCYYDHSLSAGEASMVWVAGLLGFFSGGHHAGLAPFVCL